MKVYSSSCIVTRGDHSEVRFIVGPYPNRDAALADLLVPVTKDDGPSFPRAQISAVTVQHVHTDMLRNWLRKVDSDTEAA